MLQNRACQPVIYTLGPPLLRQSLLALCKNPRRLSAQPSAIRSYPRYTRHTTHAKTDRSVRVSKLLLYSSISVSRGATTTMIQSRRQYRSAGLSTNYDIFRFAIATLYGHGSSSENNVESLLLRFCHRAPPSATSRSPMPKAYCDHKAGERSDTANEVSATTSATLTSHISFIGPISAPLLSLMRRGHIARLRNQISSQRVPDPSLAFSRLRLQTRTVVVQRLAQSLLARRRLQVMQCG